ncbi:hypothetical protein PC116_g11102 [Phytophthora cactorum]|nr:hypothetical protein PC116_g11102 [Phytophthora cactorum]
MEFKDYSFYRQCYVEETGTTYVICTRYRSGYKARLIVRNNSVKARNEHTCSTHEDAPPAIKDVRSEMRTRTVRPIPRKRLAPSPDFLASQLSSIREPKPPEATHSEPSRAYRRGTLPQMTQDLFFSLVWSTRLGAGNKDTLDLVNQNSSGYSTLLSLRSSLTAPSNGASPVHTVSHCDDEGPRGGRTGRLLEPATVTCDFEHGLMNAITEQFPLVKIVGCLFHWKQALRRKMVELRIARPQISAVLRPGVIDVLTIIPVDQIADKGIRFVRAQMDETGNKTKWDAFWRYFRKTWMTSYGADLWNVNSMTESGIDLQNRTTTR